MDREFDLIPQMFSNSLFVKDRKNWEEVLQTNINIRMNLIVNNEDNNIHFSIATKEITTVQLFFDSFLDEFKELKIVARNVLKKKKKILGFDWPNESTYEQWNSNHCVAIKKLQMTPDGQMPKQDFEVVEVEEETED